MPPAFYFYYKTQEVINHIITGQINSNLASIFFQSSHNIKFLGELYLPDEKLNKMSEIFVADVTTIYMFINFYHGKQMVLGYCYSGEEQDKYGAQIMLRSFPLEFSILRVRGLWEGIWGDWKDI